MQYGELGMILCNQAVEERDAAPVEAARFVDVATPPADHAERAKRGDKFQVVCSDPLLLDVEGLA